MVHRGAVPQRAGEGIIMWNELSLLKDFVYNRVKRVPLKLNLNLTSRCNSRCKTCNIWTVYQHAPEKVKDELTEKEIKRVLHQPGVPISWLALTGGEPFLRNDLEHLLLFIINECPSIQLLSIPSNGLDKKSIISCLAKIKDQKRLALYITFSLDGPPEVHDFIRGIKNTYHTTWDTYTEVRKLVAGNNHFRVGLETTISKYNADYVNAFLSQLITEQHRVIVTIAHNAQFYKNEEQGKMLPSEKSIIIKTIVENLETSVSGLSPENILRRVYLKNCIPYAEDSRTPLFTCSALHHSLTMDPYGNVFPCTMWGKQMGNIKDYNYNLMAFWNSAERVMVRKEITKGLCPHCWTPCEAYPTIIENFYRASVLRNIW